MGFSAFAQTPTHMPSKHVAGFDWSKMKILTLESDEETVNQICSQNRLQQQRKNSTYYGCSIISFPLKECHIIVRKGNKEAYQHELKHCQGYDHPDGPLASETGLEKGLILYKKYRASAIKLLTDHGASKDEAVFLVDEKLKMTERANLSKNKINLDHIN